MKALLLDQAGSPDNLYVGEAPDPEPGPGEIRIDVCAAALNPADLGAVQMGLPDWEWPHIPGIDAAGVVTGLGPGVAGDHPELVPGARVAFHINFTRQGSFAQQAIGLADTAAVIPEGVSFRDAGAIVAAGLTAYQALTRRLRVQTGQTVLVTGGAGGVGGYAVQLAHTAGARVLATASAANADYVRHLGADEVIDYAAGDVVARVRDLTKGHGVDAAVDTVGPNSVAQVLQTLVYGGGVAAVAGAPDPSAQQLLTGPSVHQIALGAALITGDADDRVDLGAMLGELLGFLADGTLDPCIRRTVALDEIPDGLRELHVRHGHGKIVYSAET